MSVLIINRGLYNNINSYKINLYRYGVLWKTLNVPKGQSIVVGKCDVAYDDDTFYGWSISSSSTVRKYTATSSIKPTADMNLYAVFSYTETTEEPTYTVSGTFTSGDNGKSITVPKFCNVIFALKRITITFSGGQPSSSMGEANYNDTYAGYTKSYNVTINNISIGNYPKQSTPYGNSYVASNITPNSIIKIITIPSSISSGNTYNGTQTNYQMMIAYETMQTSTTTKYRVVSHS